MDECMEADFFSLFLFFSFFFFGDLEVGGGGGERRVRGREGEGGKIRKIGGKEDNLCPDKLI